MISIKRFLKLYLSIYAFVILAYVSIGNSYIVWEADDYTLPTVSIMKDFKISISQDNIKEYIKIFPEFSFLAQNYKLANDINEQKVFTRDGNRELAWYFPTYGALAIPFVKLMQFLDFPAGHAYVYLNLFLFMIFLYLVLNYLKVSDNKKLFLILLASLNPIIIIIKTVSAESLIYSLIGISLIFWHNRAYYRAAFTISLAGTMNPIAMVIGFGIIFNFLYELFKKNNFIFTNAIKKNIKSVIILGCCFIISIIPMFYFYYHTGHINLTSAVLGSIDGSLERFIAYLFDLNFGFLPYYTFIFLLSIVMFVVAFFKKEWRYIGLFIIFLAIVYLYSFVVHINCGMYAIARYNAWNAIIMLFAVILYFDKIFTNKIVLCICNALIVISLILNIVVTRKTRHTPHVYFTPIAYWTLTHYPELYNPLFSTFNSRLNHLDGGYKYTTPMIFIDKQGYARKILASKKDTGELKKSYIGLDAKSVDFFNQELNNLGSEDSYISIPKRYKIVKNK